MKALGVFAAVYAKMAQPIELRSGGLTHVGPKVRRIQRPPWRV